MHEMAISESIVGLLEAEAARHKFARIKTVWLEIGPLAAIEIEALRFTFDVVRRGTVAADALLQIIPTEGRAWCYACAASVPVSVRGQPCPRCGAEQLQVTQGDEMRIKELEVE